MKSTIEIFTSLAKRIEAGIPTTVIEQAVAQNSWFTSKEIEYAAEAIASKMLQSKALESWISNYALKSVRKRTMVIMAGNIPMVGFFDILCVIMAGDELYIKPSHKDRVLTEWIVNGLKEIEPTIPIYIIEQEIDDIDRVIATGSDATALHFMERYGKRDIPTLLRGTRHSIAVIGERFTEEQSSDLASDIYLYSGLGCRNVSMIFVPRGFNLAQIHSIENNTKYYNNYLQNRALQHMLQSDFIDTGCSCLVYSDQFPKRLSSISIFEYDSLKQVYDWLESHDSEIQCIVSDCIEHPRQVAFGSAQQPTLYDYADGVDTMKFLLQ